jgi:signal peptidase I
MESDNRNPGRLNSFAGEKKNKWVGALLNFSLPGLGNAYARKVTKGIVIYILFLVVFVSLRFLAYDFSLFLSSLVLIIGYYVWQIVSAYRDVNSNEVYPPTTFDKGYAYMLVVVLHTALLTSISGRTLDRLTPINFANNISPAMGPSLNIGDKLAYKKTKKIERNTVTLFWFPKEPTTMYVNRCIGLPGDSLEIKAGSVFANNVKLTGSQSFKFKYVVRTNGSEINPRILNQFEFGDDDYYRIAPDRFEFFMTKRQSEEFSKLKFVKEVVAVVQRRGEAEEMIFGQSAAHNWNTDFYGPIYVPKQGDRIELTANNIDVYFACIEHENESVEKNTSGLSINGQHASIYVFKENYFFMMGDNRHNSLDSRYWGFLPQSLVVGKALYVYYSRSSDRIGKEII